MEAQTFRAPNVAAALEEVQRKLGPEAIVISVRQVPPGAIWQVWKTPEVEVIAVPAAPGGLKPADAASEPPGSAQPPEKLAGERRRSAPPSDDNKEKNRPAPVRRKPKPAGLDPSLEDKDARATAIANAIAAVAAQTAPATVKPALEVLPRLDTQASAIPAAARSKTPPEDMGHPAPVELPKVAVTGTSQPMSIALIKMKDRLLAQGVDEILVNKLITTCMDSLSPKTLKDEARLRDHLRQQLQALMRTRVVGSLMPSRVICLIGLSGSGKTSTCAKLAAHHSRNLGQKVVWISADTVSTGAISEARLYTDALGIPLYLAYTPEELGAAVAENASADLVLVDTTSCNPYKEANLIELGDFLTTLPNRVTYLVAQATSKDSDLIKAMSAFSAFNLKGLIITRLDETNTYGNIFNLAWRSQLPLVHFSAGRRVPEDLQPAQPGHLVSAIFGEGWVS